MGTNVHTRRNHEESVSFTCNWAASGRGGDLTIKQAGNVLTISRMVNEDTMVTSYTMDGADHTATPVQTSASDLETLDYAKSTISLDGAPKAHVTSGNNIVVEGSDTNHDKFQHDVILTATLWDASGKSVGTASGRLEDLPAGRQGDYKLVGTTTSPTWAQVSVVISNVTEHVAIAQLIGRLYVCHSIVICQKQH